MNKFSNKKSILFVSNVAFMYETQLFTLIDYLNSCGWDVHVVCNKKPNINNINFHLIDFKREISIIYDLYALIKLYFLIKNNKFLIIHSFQPKSGFISSIAAKLANKPIRLHTYTGQVWVTLTGIKKFVVKACDIVIAKLNTHCYCDSLSQKIFLISEGVIKDSDISVLCKGSLAGINLERFNFERYTKNNLIEIRKSLSYKSDDFIILFVGRLSIDKGIKELIDAYLLVKVKHNKIKLLICGPIEESAKKILISYNLHLQTDITILGFTNEPEKFMSIANLLVLPSYREGFGTVIIEANAMGVPSVGTDIPGLRDSILNQITGILVPVYNVTELALAINKLIEDKLLLQKFASNSLLHSQDFSSILLNKAMVQEYDNYLHSVI